MVNKSKSAITLAEIIIVVVILAIIAGVFVAMPKKNVGQMDKAKYYVAYDMLKRLLDEQLADSGEIALNNGNNNDSFCKAVNKWLNLTSDLNCGAAIPPTAVQLTNGMVLGWTAPPTINDGKAVRRVITIDIDGKDDVADDTEACTPVDHQDCHQFTLDKWGFVTPAITNSDWLTFKVYTFNNNGTQRFTRTNVDYNNAIRKYCCSNQLTNCQFNNGENNPVFATSDNCGADWGADGPSFIEPIMPLGR